MKGVLRAGHEPPFYPYVIRAQRASGLVQRNSYPTIRPDHMYDDGRATSCWIWLP